MTDYEIEKRFESMTTDQKLIEERNLHRCINKTKIELGRMTVLLNRLRDIDADIQYHQKHLSVLKIQNALALKESKLIFA